MLPEPTYLFPYAVSQRVIADFPERETFIKSINLVKNNPISEMDSLVSFDSDMHKIDLLKSWSRGLNRKNFCLIHSVSSNNYSTPLFKGSANAILSKWDVISCSLVNYANRGDANFSSDANGAHPIHLELDVPVQNILGTHSSDVAFPNHAGRKFNSPTGKVLDSSALTRHIFKGINRFSLKIDSHNGYANIINFQDFIVKCFSSRGMGHNEILLIGRPGINLYRDMPCTRMIKVKGISYVPAHLKRCYYNAFLHGGRDHALKKVSEQVVVDIESIKKLMRENNLICFTNRLYNDRGEYGKTVSDLLSEHFFSSGVGVYRGVS